MGRDLMRRGNTFTSEKAYIQRVKTKTPRFEYIGGTIKDDYLYIMCRDCGSMFKRTKQSFRPSESGHIICQHCNSILDDIKKREHIKERTALLEEKREKRCEKKLAEHKRICKYCGKEFLSGRNQYTYCSADCRNRYKNRLHELNRRIKIKANIRDSGISIEKLIKRDGCKCWLCGKDVDKTDYCVRHDGTFVAGPNYPSIEHVVALSNGGQHSWNNVKLAHVYCNTLKSNKLVTEEENGQLKLFC